MAESEMNIDSKDQKVMLTDYMKLEQAARQALEALVVAEEFVDRHSEDWYISGQQDLKQIREAITALQEALAEQAEQEPVAWLWINEQGSERLEWEPVQDISKWKSTPLYAAPVRTKDLTDDDKANLVMEHLGAHALTDGKMSIYEAFLLGVEKGIAADREKNRG